MYLILWYASLVNCYSFEKLHKGAYIMGNKKLRGDATIREYHPLIKVIDDYAESFAVSVKSMSGNFYDIFEQCTGKHKCTEEEFRYIERLWDYTVKALERVIDAALYLNDNEPTPSSELCGECIDEMNRLLGSDYGDIFIGGDGEAGYELTKLFAKASEIYAAAINRNLRTLIGEASPIYEPSQKKYDFPKKTIKRMEDLCKHQADASYSVSEISAYFNNLVRYLKNKR